MENEAMQLKTVSVTYGRKFNLGDYNSATIDCSLWAELEEGEDEAAAMTALWEMAKNNVKAQAIPLVTKQTANVEQIFMGLPVAVQKQFANGKPTGARFHESIFDDDGYSDDSDPGHPNHYGDK